MNRYFIYFSYKGSAYHGSQRQPNGISVQQVLEESMSTILRMPLSLVFAGRTDAGVHAESMVAHFDIEQPITNAANVVLRLNSLLPPDIAVSRILMVSSDAHARFDAFSREYEYRCVDYKSPFLQGMTARVSSNMNYALMNEAARLLWGKHDFASFCKVHTDVKTTLCDVKTAVWEERDNIHVFTIVADRFLRNMVRAIVGTLFEVGKGNLTLQQFAHIIDQKDRRAAGQSAPAEGLFLTQINYPENIFLN